MIPKSRTALSPVLVPFTSPCRLRRLHRNEPWGREASLLPEFVSLRASVFDRIVATPTTGMSLKPFGLASESGLVTRDGLRKALTP